MSGRCPSHQAEARRYFMLRTVHCDFCNITGIFKCFHVFTKSSSSPELGSKHKVQATECKTCRRGYPPNAKRSLYKLHRRCWACDEETSRQSSWIPGVSGNDACGKPVDGSEVYLLRRCRWSWQVDWQDLEDIRDENEVDLDRLVIVLKDRNRRTEKARKNPLMECDVCG